MPACAEERQASAHRGDSPLVLRSVPHVNGIQALRRLYHVVHCPRQEFIAVLGSAQYTYVFAKGQGCLDYLTRLATRVGDHVDVCAQVPAKIFEGDRNKDISMWGTTSTGSFVELVSNVDIDCVVHAQRKFTERPAAHVVVGPDGFHLCTYLKLLSCGLQWSHNVGALVTELGRGHELLSECIHPRWRTSCESWTLYSANLNDFDGRERGTYVTVQ